MAQHQCELCGEYAQLNEHAVCSDCTPYYEKVEALAKDQRWASMLWRLARRRGVVQEQSVEEKEHGTYYKHPSYAMFQINRTQGNPGALFGSRLPDHPSFFSLSISPGYRVFHLGHDRFHGSLDHYIEVHLSAAQFVEAITSLNMGSGVPCTLDHFDGIPVPPPNGEETELEKARDKLLEVLNGATGGSEELIAKIEEELKVARMSKKRQEDVLFLVRKVAGQISSSAPFYAEQVGGALDKQVSAAKVEFETFVQGLISKAGLQALEEGGVDVSRLLGAPRAEEKNDD